MNKVIDIKTKTMLESETNCSGSLVVEFRELERLHEQLKDSIEELRRLLEE